MTDTTTTANPLRGHVVNFPKAIPSRDWLAQRMLWADHLGAVWPMGAPSDRSEEEYLALADARAYMKAGFFTPCVLSKDTSPLLTKRLKTAMQLPDTEIGRWVRSLKTAAFDQLNPDTAPFDEPVDENQFFYVNKFPRPVQRMLLQSGVAKQDGDWLTVRTAKQASALMSALAAHAKPLEPLDMPRTLDTSNVNALAQAAAPSSAADSTPAAVIDIPVIGGVIAAEVKAEDLIEFRLSDANERARQDYLVARVVNC